MRCSTSPASSGIGWIWPASTMIEDIGLDTYPDPRFFSYRRTVHRQEADYGRHVHAIALVP